ncbi:hypothetical protein GQ53DRAFT_174618 [Thozetella sp. PMI_491]|nr:hypothetical protein GQ53DRAFT_174618 [Thozetella sp. PMI_491]
MFLDGKNRRARVRPRLRRLLSNRCLLLASFALFLVCLATFSSTPSYEWPAPLQFFDFGPERMAGVEVLPPLAERVPCFGPRNKLLSSSPDDDLGTVSLNHAYPRPFVGSYEDVQLDKTWMTFEDRYAPYGYNEDSAGSKRSKVNWDAVNWDELQNRCFNRNAHRFHPSAAEADQLASVNRMNYRNRTAIRPVQRWNEFNSTRRTAIVVRAYSGYQYKPEDMYYLRSLIVETGLRTGAEYKVILLVDIKDLERKIFDSDEAYQKALVDAGVPPELRSITVLWDENLVKSWYPKVEEYRTMWQVYQPMQLFALYYPEFDHFWQLELDMRFTGDAGLYLDTLANFARREPRKQMLERSTFQQMQDEIGSYKSLQEAVNVAAVGGSYVWGPLRIPEVKPIGPVPPTRDPLDDNFSWGVGEEAAVIVTSFCSNATNAHHWVFKDWIYGFGDNTGTPRFFCPPAIMRTSRSLLLAIHESQLVKGLRVPSEATPVSFALWNGLKISYPPQPLFWRLENDEETRKGWWKGGPANSTRGIGPQDATHPGGDGLSFWWESSWPRKVVNAWMGNETPDDEEFPWILTKKDGAVYAPNMLLHPVKH